MASTFLFIVATLLLSLNFVRPFGLAISDWFYFGALISAFFETLLSKRQSFSEWFQPNFFFPAILISVGAMISLINTRNIPVAIFELIQQLYVITVFISLIGIMVRRGKTELIVTVFILSGVFSSTVAVVDFYLGTIYGPILSGTPYVQLWGRYAGSLGHPNKLGYFLVITTILTLYKLMVSIRKRKYASIKIVIIIVIVIQVFGIYLSGSVTAYLGLLVGLICLLYATSPSGIRKVVISLGFIMILILLMVTIFKINSLTNQKLGISDNSLIGKGINRVIAITAETRIDLFNSSIKLIVKSPLVGVGYDQISTSNISMKDRIIQGTIHNILLQSWYTGGFFSILGWFIIYIRIGLIAFKNINLISVGNGLLKTAFAVTSISILLMDQMQDSIYQREKWLVLGLLVGYTSLKTKKKKFFPEL